jgi:hypothetical protein
MTSILILIASAWMLALWLAAGLCAAARLGDHTQVADCPGAPTYGQRLNDGLTISVHADLAAGRDEAAVAALASGSLAA